MRQTLADIEARHADIKKLEKSIIELHEMFVDMATLGKNIIRIINILIEYSINYFLYSRTYIKILKFPFLLIY